MARARTGTMTKTRMKGVSVTVARGRGRPKKQDKPKAPPGWTEEQWLDMQRRWREDPYGALDWAIVMNLKNERGEEMEWFDRNFLVDILCDMHPKQVIVKCTQVGLSTVMILKTHFMAQVFGYGVIYTLPTYKLLLEFDKTKITPLLQKNPNVYPTGDVTIGAHVYENAGYVLFRGTMGDSQDISLTADIIVADEADRSDLSVIEGLESRLMASKYKAQWWFTNPTRPDVGTDKKWQLSDKREWHVRCPHCGEEQTLDYWENIATETVVDENGVETERHYFKCRICHQEWENDREVRRNGRWVPTDPGKEWHGYHISQLCAPWITAKELVEAERTKSKEFFYNYMLGLPAVGDGLSVEKELILGSVVERDDQRYALREGTKKFMGVDVNRLLSVVIGNEHGITKILYLGDDKGITQQEREDINNPKSKWGKLVRLMDQERINLCVIDNNPPEKQRQFQSKFRFRVWRCVYDYNDSRKEIYEEKRELGVLNAHRTQVIDKVIEEFGLGNIPIFVDSTDPLLVGDGSGNDPNCYVRHFTNLYQVGLDGQDENIVKRDRMGNVIRTWEHAGRDDFVHATVYYYLARQVGTPLGGGSSFLAGSGTPPQPEEDRDEEQDEDTAPMGFYSL
ncbi:MAG: hypothetical protein CWE10_04595 [Symbiobacterium thermophilum]|uniref:Phage terminase large subunit GpA ATPase domain-containing protein n=2 Tax=Symbiobacterium thermophilum TaxID=2734 RepID=A0A953I7P7_SYMTR|nr:hypothetical protein [Symbiobacterium thermophilum]